MSSEESRQEIRNIVHELNNAWATGHPEQLAEFFHKDIVVVSPDFSGRAEGRDACIASYADFCSQATIHGVNIGEPGVEVFGDTAVATYAYELDYEMGGERFKDSGRDLFVFVREDGKWQAVWRTMIISQPDSVN
jgi:uncharacterized protein (TIGR02246 family)